tara:strand:+ start:206 stop:367 length:162 start_codon:yes stop_codon:yes gene_type:complete
VHFGESGQEEVLMVKWVELQQERVGQEKVMAFLEQVVAAFPAAGVMAFLVQVA